MVPSLAYCTHDTVKTAEMRLGKTHRRERFRSPFAASPGLGQTQACFLYQGLKSEVSVLDHLLIPGCVVHTSEILGKCFGLTTCARCKGRCSPFLEGSRAPAGCVVREYVHAPGGIQGSLLVGVLPRVKLHGSYHFTSYCGPLSSGPLGCLWGPSTLAWAALYSKARATWAPEPETWISTGRLPDRGLVPSATGGKAFMVYSRFWTILRP